ncbi:hypothetical protein L603_001700000030 [Cellulosimicrobium cellulans J34]|nr:hypothetical protein L603_001700000030 [Cellulosimicrobium cellulans J34]
MPATGVDDSVNVQDLVGGLRLVELCARTGVPGVTEETPYAAAVDSIREHAGSPAVHDLVEDLARRVAIVLQPVVAILEPDAVVLGGPTGVACGAALAETTVAALRATDQRAGTVVASAVPELAVLRGARSVVAQDVRTLLLAAAGRPDHPVVAPPVPG